MSVVEQTPVTQYAGNGTTRAFAIGFDLKTLDDLVITVNGVVIAAGLYTATLTTITFTLAPVLGAIVLFTRVTPLQRTTDYNAFSGYLRPDVINADFDQIWRALQEAGYKITKEISDRIAGDDALRAYITDLLSTFAIANGSPDSFLVVKQPYIGAVPRTQHDKNADMVSVKDFGAKGDGLRHPLSEKFPTLSLARAVYPFVTSLTQSVDWAALQAASNTGKNVFVPAGIYLCNETVRGYADFYGEGCDEWDQKGTWRLRKMGMGKTTVLFYDTPTSFVNVVGVSNVDVGGGVLLNDNYMIPAPNDIPSEDFAGNQYYSLLDYTNANASGATMATPKNLKVGFQLFNGATLNNLRVQLNYLGVDGYNSCEGLPPIDFPEYTTSYKGLGDNWDIGVLTYNSLETGVRDCQIVGYWRMAARAVVSANFGDGKSFGGAWFYDSNIYYQGFVGLSIRGNDTYRILSSTANTLTVAWSASHQIPTSGTAYISGTGHTYTGLSYTAGSPATLTLTGFVDNISVLPTNPRLTMGVNPAFAGSSVKEGFITDMNHFSNYRPYDPIMDTPTAHPGHAHEVSGNPLRNIDFSNIHFFANDVVGWEHSASQCSYIQCYAEATGYASSVDNTGVNKGARWIACPRPDSADIRTPYSSGWCSTLSFDDSCQFGDGSIDWYPMHRSTSATRRFSGTAKWFMPDVVRLDAVGSWTERNMGWTGYNIGTRQFSSGSSYQWGVSTPQFDYQFFIDSSAAIAGNDPTLINIGIGTTSSSTTLGVLRTTSPGISLIQTGNSTATDPFYQLGNKLSPDGGTTWVSHTWTMRSQGGSLNQYQLRYDNNIRFQVNPTTGTLFSGADNTADIGTSSNRYKTIYAATGTINTSDERHKQQISAVSDAERAVALEIKASIKRFKFTDAVVQKGNGARWHVGVIAQAVISIMQSHGLDPMAYAFVCYDSWSETPEVIGVMEDDTGMPMKKPRLDEDGNPIKKVRIDNDGVTVRDDAGQIVYDDELEDVIGVVIPYRPAGDIYGIRYDELVMFLLAAT